MNKSEIKQKLKELKKNGKTKEQIYQELLGEGVKVELIEEAFDEIEFQDSKKSKESKSSKRVIKIILTAGAVLIGAGIFSFIAANWAAMPRLMRVAVILISMLTSYSAGWYFREVKGLQKTGSSLILLGTIIYGAGLFLVAQMFNIRAAWPDGFILWMLGAIAVAYVMDSSALLYLGAILGFITVIGEPSIIFGFPEQGSFLFTPPVLLFLASLATFFIGWQMHSRIDSELKERYF